MPHSLLTLAWSLPDPTGALLTAFGIGLVIFVHEFGHFLCARITGVDVEVFSLGFGPRLFGFVRNGTDYRISAVPVGGYVKVRGDQPGEDLGNPRSYNSKSIGAKFLVRAGGVIANLLFAMIVFPLTFGAGVEMEAPVLGRVVAGGPAWKAGLRADDEVIEINGHPIHSFTDVFLEVALGDPEGVPITVLRGSQKVETVAQPEYSTALGTYAIKVDQALTGRVRLDPDGAAARAGLVDGDEIVAIAGCERRELFSDLLTYSSQAPLSMRVRSAQGAFREVQVAPEWRTDSTAKLVGIAPVTLTVTAVREVLAGPDSPLHVGDRILACDGVPLFTETDFVRALSTARGGDASTDLEVDNAGARRHIAISAALRPRLIEYVALGATDSSGGAGVPIVVTSGSAAERVGLHSGDRLVRVDGEQVSKWTDAFRAIHAASDRPIQLAVDSGGALRDVEVTRAGLSYPDFGIAFEAATVVRRYPWAQAFGHGMYASWNMTRQVYLTLKKMVSRQVSTENLGSIVSISVVSYHVAMQGLAKLFYFLAMLSINLAVINVLPIPILDGGYMMFLLVEKVTGAPISERVMGYSQLIGLAFIFALLIYVIKNDIQRLLF